MKNVPLHQLSTIPYDNIKVERIDYPNPYDYKKLHRHDYYEILLIKEGGGRQIIDFEESTLKSDSVYVVCPGQVHLLDRSPESLGWLVQFTQEALFRDEEVSLPIYELQSMVENHQVFEQTYQVYQLLEQHTKASTNQAIRRHYLHILLLILLDAASKNDQKSKIPVILKQFLRLLDEHLNQEKTVLQYAQRLMIHPRKLGELCKKHWGKTALQLIHERLILEIKRLLMVQELTHKEIAYQLQFDSPAAFSAFVKKKTSYTPTELQLQLEQIYK